MKISIKKAARAFGSIVGAVLVAGCGGGGSGSSAAPVAVTAPASAAAPAAAPAATAAQYLSWASARKADGSTSVVILDEASPAPPRFSFSLSDLRSKLVSSLASTVDAAAATETVLGDAALFYVEGGVVKKISLKKSSPQTPQQLSTLTNVCRFFDDQQVDLLGEDLWLGVITPGPDNNCATNGDNARFYLRSTMTGTSAPLVWSTTLDLVTGLTEADGSVGSFLVNEQGSTLALYNASLQRVASVANGTGVSTIDELAIDLTSAHSAYFIVNDRLRRLSWTPGGAALSADLYSFLDLAGTRSGASDRATTFFTDGNRVLRIDAAASAASAVAAIPGTADATDPIALTPTAVIIAAVNGGKRATIYAQPRNGSAAIDLTGLTTSTGQNAYLEALRDESIVFTQTKSDSLVRELRIVSSNGQNNRLIADGVSDLFNGHIFSATVSLNNDSLAAFRLDSVIACQPASGQSDCSPSGNLVQYDLSTAAATTLGSIAASSGQAATILTNVATSGLPFALSVFSIDASLLDDAYLGVAGRANSLIPVLRNRP